MLAFSWTDGASLAKASYSPDETGAAPACLLQRSRSVERRTDSLLTLVGHARADAEAGIGTGVWRLERQMSSAPCSRLGQPTGRVACGRAGHLALSSAAHTQGQRLVCRLATAHPVQMNACGIRSGPQSVASAEPAVLTVCISVLQSAERMQGRLVTVAWACREVFPVRRHTTPSNPRYRAAGAQQACPPRALPSSSTLSLSDERHLPCMRTRAQHRRA